MRGGAFQRQKARAYKIRINYIRFIRPFLVDNCAKLIMNIRCDKQRVIFPLSIHRQDSESKIEKGGWKTEHFFMRQGYYTLFFDNDQQMQLMKDTSINEAIVEKIQLRKNLVKDYVFNRIRGAWMLREIRETTIAENINSSFLSFYQRFVTDSAYQVKSLSPMVTFVGPDPDDDFSTIDGVITPDFWEAFRPELPQHILYNMVYGRQDPAATHKILLVRGIANGLEVEITFRLHKGRWKLTKLLT